MLSDRPRSCENQLRACFASDELDNEMEEASSLWLSLCKTYITYTPTTPVLSEVTSSFDDAFCNTVVKSACGAATVALDKCDTILDESLLSECVCQPSILRYDYTCEYMGNITCFSTAAALSNLFLSSACANFDSVIGTGLVGSIPSAPCYPC
ncbi:hypothetical protein GQ53DRAFT_415420 [Thozetella sp. PMI_491]|nr:hypothetical protein GQ53DRAFT_415420 [Thozetella sp. PMI_491]